MKKWLSGLCVLLLVCNCLSAEIAKSRYKITESEKEFDITYYQTPDMKIIEPKENDDVNVTQSFVINKNNTEGELRYSLFTDLGGDQKTLKLQYAMWVYMCANNISGFEVPASSFSNFNDEDVKNEFNGNFGCTAFIQNPESSYGSGYKYMMVEFFCKEGQGLVMRTYLFNTMDFVGIDGDGNISESSLLFNNYHTFKFMDKDDKGNYIVK